MVSTYTGTCLAGVCFRWRFKTLHGTEILLMHALNFGFIY